MVRWETDRRVRRRAVLALALLAHAALIDAMLRSRVSHERPPAGATLEAMIWPAPAPPRTRVAPAPAPRPAPLRALARPAPPARAIHAAPLEPQPLSQAPVASAPAPVASAASQPLDLALTRAQIRALIAQDKPTLAQLGPHAAAASPFDRLAGEGDGMILIERPHGVTEVHLHGECFRLIPTPRALSDPFNHANERLTGPCLANF